MIPKKANRSITPTEGVIPSKPSEKFESVYVAGPIGVQGEPSLEEWFDLRKAMFDELSKFPIPPNIVDAVREFRPYAAVAWLNDKDAAAGPEDDSVHPIVAEHSPDSRDPTDRLVSNATAKFRELSKPSLPTTAGETLAIYLRHQLVLADGGAAPVRLKKMLAPSIIAGIATDMLEIYSMYDQPVGKELITLFRALLKVNKRRLKSSREYPARYQAAWIIAQRPSVGTRKLARILKVEPSSVSRWRKDASFRKSVASAKQSLEVLKGRGLWPPPLLGVADMENKAVAKKLNKIRKTWSVLSRLYSRRRHKFSNEQAARTEEIIKKVDELIQKIGPRSI
jgi:hypothetical protein